MGGPEIPHRPSGAFLEVEGIRTYFERRGAGHTVLLLHGGGGTVESVEAQASELEHHFDLVIPERRCHGRSSCSEDDLTYELMADDTSAFLDELGVRHAYVVGQSDGSNVGLLLASKRPDLVRKLVMICGNYSNDYLTPESREWLRNLSPDEARKVFSAVAEPYFKVVPDAPKKWPVLVSKLIALYASDWRVSREALGRVAAPTLIVTADRDSIPLSHSISLFEALPNSQLFVVPDSSHSVARDRPEIVNAAILRFLTA